jgi:threonine aldolase
MTGGQSEPEPAVRERGFASDNYAGVLPQVLEAIAAANTGHAVSYGGDQWTARLEELFRAHFGDEARAAIVFNGTGANVVALQALTRPYEAAICASTAHLNVDECGAPERTRSPRWPHRRTSAGCCCTSTARGWRTRRPRSTCPCAR